MDIPRHWRLRNQRYQLEGSACRACGAVYFPPRAFCKACRGRDMEPHPLSRRGTLASFTVVHQSPDGYEGQVPYAVALVDVEEGPRLTAMLTDADLETLAIGMPVEMVIRKLSEEGEEGPIQYGYKFRPVWPG